MVDRTQEVLDSVTYERENQDLKWGLQSHGNEAWAVILMEEVGEAAREVFESARTYPDSAERSAGLQRLEAELIQVAAVAVAWIECIRRNRA